MSRVIKFRAWDKQSNEMIDSSRNIRSDYDEYCFDVFAIQLGGIEEINKNDRFEVMQFTGLQDKNGKDACEGDIVSDHNGIGVIEYSNQYAGFRVDYRNGQCKWFYDYILDGERESIEVIGNIYENPDLLVN